MSGSRSDEMSRCPICAICGIFVSPVVCWYGVRSMFHVLNVHLHVVQYILPPRIIFQISKNYFQPSIDLLIFFAILLTYLSTVHI